MDRKKTKSPLELSAPKSLGEDELRTVAGGYIQRTNPVPTYALWALQDIWALPA